MRSDQDPRDIELRRRAGMGLDVEGYDLTTADAPVSPPADAQVYHWASGDLDGGLSGSGRSSTERNLLTIWSDGKTVAPGAANGVGGSVNGVRSTLTPHDGVDGAEEDTPSASQRHAGPLLHGECCDALSISPPPLLKQHCQEVWCV